MFKSLTTAKPAGDHEMEDEATEHEPGKSRTKMFLQGATVFVVMFVMMYAFLRWRISAEENE